MIVTLGLGGMFAVLALAVAASYNRFVRQHQLIDNAWANVDTELHRRYDLIPNLVETVRGYAHHERTALTQARSQAAGSNGSPVRQATDENVLVSALRGLLAAAEAYPDLKANEGFLDLQRQLVATEDRIQAARRFYNNVRDYNTRVQSVPTNLVARAFDFNEREYLEIDEALPATSAPTASFED